MYAFSMVLRVSAVQSPTHTIEEPIIPGFTDVHVHLREPGFLYKETIATGTRAAAAGGFTNIITMPNLNPCPDCMENLKVQLDALKKDAIVNAAATGAITTGEKGETLADFESMSDQVAGFSDDGRGVMSEEMMRQAMTKAKALGQIIIAHCEDENYPKNSAEAEYRQLERDLKLVRETGCRYHACHISTWQSVELMRQAKAEGLDVSCETAPHYLTIDAEYIEKVLRKEKTEMGDATFAREGRFKMNPPIKGRRDRESLVEGLRDGTIDMIATDHAPHSTEEKSRGFAGSAFGIVGMETAFPVLYTELVMKNVISMEKLIELMAVNPARRFGFENPIAENDGELPDSFTLWNLDEEYTIDPDRFETKGRSTPFEGWKVSAKAMATVIKGKMVWQR